jgi:hypothetical protein
MCSVLATFEGINPIACYPCDYYARHMLPLPEHNLSYTDDEIFESEYDRGLWDRYNLAPEDEDERIAAEEKMEAKEEWKAWDELRNIQVQGVVTFGQAMAYLDHIGAIFEDCETMGTIGGPLGLGIVPDVPFRIESALVIGSIRITPFWTNGDDWTPLTEASWERVRELFRKYDTYDLAKMARDGKEVTV